MANVLNYPCWSLDTIGIVTNAPVTIRRILYYPTAANNAANLYCYAAGVPEAQTGAVCTVTNANLVTSTAKFPSTYGVGDVWHLYQTDGNNASLGKWMIATAGNNNGIVVTPASLTNEANKTYGWKLYSGYLTIPIKAGATDASPVSYDFDPPLKLPNLVLASISASTTLYVFIY